MIQGKTPEELKFEKEEAETERAFRAEQTELEHAHTLKMAAIQIKAAEKYASRTRVLVAFAKAPALVLLAITIPIAIMRGKKLPKELLAFLSV